MVNEDVLIVHRYCFYRLEAVFQLCIPAVFQLCIPTLLFFYCGNGTS
jgi:hypothetical protein